MTTNAVIELKTDSDVYQAVYRGEKTFEIRKNDRGYKVGDILRLRETVYTGKEMIEGNPLLYTGSELFVKVSHVLCGPFYDGLDANWCVLSFRLPDDQYWRDTASTYAIGIEERDAAIVELKKEIQHWKSNHDDKVERLRVLTQRPDLPFERIPVYEELRKEQALTTVLLSESVMILQVMIKTYPVLTIMLSDRLKAVVVPE